MTMRDGGKVFFNTHHVEGMLGGLGQPTVDAYNVCVDAIKITGPFVYGERTILIYESD